MSVYVVGVLRACNWDWYRAYIEKTAPLIARHGGKYLLRGLGAEVLEGGDAPPSAIVVLEFPTAEQARAWHDDPDYAPMIELRSSACATELVLYRTAD